MSLSQLTAALDSLADPPKARFLQTFFKTGPGQYAEGDVFLGIVVPAQRRLVALYWDVVTLADIQKLLQSKYHEYRLTGLMILVKKYPKNKKNIFNFYLKNISRINNWDLVDLTAPNIIGAYCYEHKKYSILYRLSKSTNLWEKRIAMVSTYFFLKKDDYQPTLEIAQTLLSDHHDLIHKAVGWMLREVGKRDQKVLFGFLDQYAPQLPRTTLRYAIEKLPEVQRKYYLELK